MNNSASCQYEFDFSTTDHISTTPAFDLDRASCNTLGLKEQRAIIKLATEIILESFNKGSALVSPDDVRQYLQILLADRKDEVF